MKNLDYLLWLRRESGLPHPPYGDEREFYDMVSSGDVEGILELRRKYPPEPDSGSEKGRLSDNPMRNAVYHLVANCTIITRRCIAAGMSQEQAYTLSDIFIRRADLCRSTAEVAEVNDEMALEFAHRMKEAVSGGFSSTVKRTLRYMGDNLYNKITVSDIAAAAGYNRSHLSTLFKRETGVTITECVRKMRIDEAKKLISKDVPLSAVANSLGFCSQSHFCKCFKDETGMTPLEYRDSGDGSEL